MSVRKPFGFHRCAAFVIALALLSSCGSRTTIEHKSHRSSDQRASAVVRQAVIQCPAGPLAPSSVQALPEGGRAYIYHVNKQTVKYPVPPKSFDPLTANDQLLSTYGYPPKPDASDPVALYAWKAAVGSSSLPTPYTTLVQGRCLSPASGYPGVCRGIPDPTSVQFQQVGNWPTTTGALGGTIPAIPSQVLPTATARSLFEAVCSVFPLTLLQKSLNCPVSYGVSFRLTFEANGRSVAIDTLGADGCGFIQMSYGSLTAEAVTITLYSPVNMYAYLQSLLARELGTVPSALNPTSG